jgi:hypothetical protein
MHWGMRIAYKTLVGKLAEKKLVVRFSVTCSGLLGYMFGFIGHSQVVTTKNYNILNITETVAHKIKSSMSVF